MLPGRESALGDRTICLPWLRRLLLEAETRGVTMTRALTVRRQQRTSTATSNPVAVLLQRYRSCSCIGLPISTCVMETPSPPELYRKIL